MWAADRGITEPLGNKNHRQRTHCLPVSVKHTFTPAVAFRPGYTTNLQGEKKADILDFLEHFYPQWYPAHINQLQIPWLIVFGQSARAVCYKQMLVGAGGSFLSCDEYCKLARRDGFLVTLHTTVFLKIIFNSKEQLCN